jgi:hypothetical protein
LGETGGVVLFNTAGGGRVKAEASISSFSELTAARSVELDGVGNGFGRGIAESNRRAIEVKNNHGKH